MFAIAIVLSWDKRATVRSASNCASIRALRATAAPCRALFVEDCPDVALDEGDAEREAPCGPVVVVWASRAGVRTFFPFPEALKHAASIKCVLALFMSPT